MKWIITLLCICWVCAHQTHQNMFLQFIKDDTHVIEVNQHIQVKKNGQMLIEGKKHLTLFMEIINHNNNKCFEMEKETVSYIHCYDISHVPNIIFSFAERETVLSQDLLFTYSEELSLYIMNICFINDNKSLFNKEETQLTFDNDNSEISSWQLKMYFGGWGFVLLVFLIYGIPIIGIIVILIIVVSCIVNRVRASDPQFNSTNKHQHVSSKNISRTNVVVKFTDLFPYEPENISTPQVIHQSMLSLNDNIDYVLFPKVPIYNNTINN